MSTRSIGKVAERSAVFYLKSKGYRILYTNWTCCYGEIDIVAYRDKLTFVEVKSVFSGFCSPCELFNKRKIKNLLRTIDNFLISNHILVFCSADWQLDLLCLEKINGKTYFGHYESVQGVL